MNWRQKYSTEELRRQLITKWKESGLSQAAFCKNEEMPEWALSAWKRRYTPAASNSPRPKAAKKKLSPQAQIRKAREKKKYQQRHLDARVLSGLSIAEYCRLNSIRVADFNRWLKLADCAAANEMDSDEIVPAPKTSVSFVRVRAEEESPVTSVEKYVEIIMPGGSKIRIFENSPLDLLFKVFNVLEGKC